MGSGGDGGDGDGLKLFDRCEEMLLVLEVKCIEEPG